MNADPRPYYIVWMNEVMEGETLPLLLDKSKQIQSGVNFQYSSADIIFGILHEYWRPKDPEINRPSNERLLEIYKDIVEKEFNDTFLNSLNEIPATLRDSMGLICSLNQMFSSFEISPNTPNIRKDVFGDIINTLTSGLMPELKEHELSQCFKVFEKVYEDFPLKNYSKDIGIQIAKITMLALTANGSATKAFLYLEQTSKDLNLTNDEYEMLRSIANNGAGLTSAIDREIVNRREFMPHVKQSPKPKSLWQRIFG